MLVIVHQIFCNIEFGRLLLSFVCSLTVYTRLGAVGSYNGESP